MNKSILNSPGIKEERKCIDFCFLLPILILLLKYLLNLLISFLPGTKTEVVMSLINSVITVAAYIFPLLALIKMTGIKFIFSDYDRPRRASDGILFTIFGIGGCLAINGVFMFLSFIMTFKQDNGVGYQSDILTVCIAVVQSAIIPAICEELVFRGFMLKELRPFGTVFPILLTSTVFGVMHSHPLIMVFAFCCGMLLGFIRNASGFLLIPIIVHFVNNTFSIIQDTVVGTDPVMRLIVSGAVLVGGSVLAGIAFLILKKRRAFSYAVPRHNSSLTLKEKLIGLFTSIFLYVFIFTMIFRSIQ